MNTYWIEDHGGLNEAAIQAGAQAAESYFAERGLSIDAAYEAQLAAADGREHDPVLAAAWYEAERYALQAAYSGWASRPETAHLARG